MQSLPKERIVFGRLLNPCIEPPFFFVGGLPGRERRDTFYNLLFIVHYSINLYYYYGKHRKMGECIAAFFVKCLKITIRLDK